MTRAGGRGRMRAEARAGSQAWARALAVLGGALCACAGLARGAAPKGVVSRTDETVTVNRGSYETFSLTNEFLGDGLFMDTTVAPGASSSSSTIDRFDVRVAHGDLCLAATRNESVPGVTWEWPPSADQCDHSADGVSQFSTVSAQTFGSPTCLIVGCAAGSTVSAPTCRIAVSVAYHGGSGSDQEVTTAANPPRRPANVNLQDNTPCDRANRATAVPNRGALGFSCFFGGESLCASESPREYTRKKVVAEKSTDEACGAGNTQDVLELGWELRMVSVSWYDDGTIPDADMSPSSSRRLLRDGIQHSSTTSPSTTTRRHSRSLWQRALRALETSLPARIVQSAWAAVTMALPVAPPTFASSTHLENAVRASRAAQVDPFVAEKWGSAAWAVEQPNEDASSPVGVRVSSASVFTSRARQLAPEIDGDDSVKIVPKLGQSGSIKVQSPGPLSVALARGTACSSGLPSYAFKAVANGTGAYLQEGNGTTLLLGASGVASWEANDVYVSAASADGNVCLFVHCQVANESAWVQEGEPAKCPVAVTLDYEPYNPEYEGVIRLAATVIMCLAICLCMCGGILYCRSHDIAHRAHEQGKHLSRGQILYAVFCGSGDDEHSKIPDTAPTPLPETDEDT